MNGAAPKRCLERPLRVNYTEFYAYEHALADGIKKRVGVWERSKLGSLPGGAHGSHSNPWQLLAAAVAWAVDPGMTRMNFNCPLLSPTDSDAQVQVRNGCLSPEPGADGRRS
jgi:hypothetical protein